MATLGIELSDVGVNAVLIMDDGSSRTLSLGEEANSFPACAYARSGELWFGSEAQEMNFVYPGRTCSEFLDELSFQSTNFDGHYSKTMYSQLAYKYFQVLATRIEKEVGEIDRAIIAVPGHYLEVNEKSEEHLGLLLSILADIGIPVAGIVDMAAASLYSEGLWNVPEGERIFHVDLLAHATHITVFHKRSGLERVYFARLTQHGFSKMLERFTTSMSNKFLAETSFDINEDRQIERAFNAQAREALFSFGRQSVANIEVSTREKFRQMVISKELAAFELGPQVKQLTQLVLRAVNDFANGDQAIQVALSGRVAAIQGLKESIVSQGVGMVKELPTESAAFGAANYGKDWGVVNDVEEMRVEVGISMAVIPESEIVGRTRNIASIRIIREDRSLNPTHMVCDGLGYRLEGKSFLVGVGESDGFDLVADRGTAGSPQALFALNSVDDRWMIEAMEGSSLEMQSDASLKAGDAIEILIQETRKRLLLVHCIE
jgi:hypothetical protein